MSDEKKVAEAVSPYFSLFVRRLTGSKDIQPLLDWVRDLPMEKRYVSRMLSALSLALDDFDAGLALEIDVRTLTPDEVQKITVKLEQRLKQLGQAVEVLKRVRPPQ
jgi:hypothetical protein